jgi:hypothetical protein
MSTRKLPSESENHLDSSGQTEPLVVKLKKGLDQLVQSLNDIREEPTEFPDRVLALDRMIADFEEQSRNVMGFLGYIENSFIALREKYPKEWTLRVIGQLADHYQIKLEHYTNREVDVLKQTLEWFVKVYDQTKMRAAEETHRQRSAEAGAWEPGAKQTDSKPVDTEPPRDRVMTRSQTRKQRRNIGPRSNKKN